MGFKAAQNGFSSGSTLSITLPADVAAGDELLVFFSITGAAYAPVNTPPSGWTQVFGYVPATTSSYHYLYRRRAVGNEGGQTYSWLCAAGNIPWGFAQYDGLADNPVISHGDQGTNPLANDGSGNRKFPDTSAGKIAVGILFGNNPNGQGGNPAWDFLVGTRRDRFVSPVGGGGMVGDFVATNDAPALIVNGAVVLGFQNYLIWAKLDYLSGAEMFGHLAWDVSDDLPTEDVTAPNFVRKAMGIVLPRPDLCPDEVALANPLAPSVALYRGRPINPQVQGGQIRYELEGVEARWQRARPKKSIIQVGPLTGKQALEALLAARQAEFSFISWNTIPELYWPDETVPTFPNLTTIVDSSDSRRKTVYDEVVQLLAVFPGYSLDFDSSNKLRVVIPPFAPNALAPKDLTAANGNFEETGYVTTDIVRSVRVLSRPFEFLDSEDDAIQATTARFAASGYQTYASDSAQTTKGSMSAGSNSLSVEKIIDFAVGQRIYVAGAGASGAGLVATINAISGTTLTLSASASTAVQNVLVRHAGLYPPVDDDLTTADRDIIYGSSLIESTFVIPYTPDVLVDYATFKVDIVMSRWRYPSANGIPVPEQLSDVSFLDIALPNDGQEHKLVDQPTGTWIDFGVFQQGPVRVFCKHIPGGIQCRIQFHPYVAGFVVVGLGAIGRNWELGARFRITATSKRWQQGTTEYSGEYIYESGYSDLPDLDVSPLGIADNAKLQTLARYIAEYKSRQATRYALKLSQPWALEPGDKGRRINLPGGAQVVPDAYRLGIAYGLTDVQAPFDVLAWKYVQFIWLLATAGGDLLATADGTVIEV